MKYYFATLGFICLALAAWLAWRRFRAFFFGNITSGRVYSHEKRIIDDATSYHPVIVFTDANGQQHQFTSVAGNARAKPIEGAEVRVRYLPSNPKIAYISTFLHMWAASLALVVLGCAGVAVLWVR